MKLVSMLQSITNFTVEMRWVSSGLFGRPCGDFLQRPRILYPAPRKFLGARRGCRRGWPAVMVRRLPRADAACRVRVTVPSGAVRCIIFSAVWLVTSRRRRYCRRAEMLRGPIFRRDNSPHCFLPRPRHVETGRGGRRSCIAEMYYTLAAVGARARFLRCGRFLW